MKKGIVMCMFLVALALLCAVPTQAWQGRMSGMGEASGLVEDESDFLTHPAAIAGGTGLNFYGDMRYRQVLTDKFNFSATLLDPTNSNNWEVLDFDARGKEHQYEALFGGAFPLGIGRMGIFFQYKGLDGTLRGDTLESDATSQFVIPFDQKNKLDALALRFLYGIPVGSNLKLGTEFQIAHRKETSKTTLTDVSFTQTNALYGFGDQSYSLLHLGVPYDSRYYEASLKGSVETMIGSAKAAFTARGGIPFASNNYYYYEGRNPGGFYGGDHTGKVDGYNVGADAWVRLPLNGSLSLPFLAQVDYKQLKRDAEGREMGLWSPWYGRHEDKEKSLAITAGGGMDYTPAAGTRVAGGLYYTYLKSKTDFLYEFTPFPPTSGSWAVFNHSGYPETKEHRISFKASAEKACSSDVTFNGGFNAFYGWTKQTYDFAAGNTSTTITQTFSSSLKGRHWGLGASAGVSFKAGATTFEPFIAGGLERLNRSGDGSLYQLGVLDTIYSNVDLKKNIWFIGGGFSVRF